MNLSDKHAYRVGSHSESWSDLPTDDDGLDKFIATARKRIEPWLSAVFQAEHLNLLIGSGFTTAIGYIAGAAATGMAKVTFGSEYDKQIDDYATSEAALMGRGAANIEDQFRSALAVYEGLKVIDAAKAEALKGAMDVQLKAFLDSLLVTEAGLAGAAKEKRIAAQGALQSFLLSFASRAASRERLHIFTSNYDRLIEHGCDLAGLRIIDRFVGALTPVFRSARVEVDVHYNPPGIRGEPRFMEGVIRVTKLHGSLDWQFDKEGRKISRKGIPFGAPPTHTDMPTNPVDTVMIYPNPAKDVETTQYPYAELFRDFAAATCRPNAVVVTYGYGFGDDHINRVLLDMLTIPSTHLVVFAYEADDRLKGFLARTRNAQVSLLIGPHFGDLTTLIENYLPKPTLDYITGRMAELLKNRPLEHQSPAAQQQPPEVEGLAAMFGEDAKS
ncbi:fibronectin-binding protein (FBP) [Sphingobium sp. Leaf26]|uniref:SIR2 family protein n=1 Tax=Sphingobium sp. Leaf26 TaxID=1735693 RepID=UPI0006F59ACF|nr:SIR2 family protein [Sphingobium sp. Leaf26]KQN01811.1 fibronectin-binding protein (FBP) [Sphingobium sp. Leaf26]